MEAREAVLTELSRNKTTAEFVFEKLRHDIVVGRLKPGQRLVERELTERFEVSRTPVREALKLLVRTQLAVNIPYRGVEVRSLKFEFARNLYDLRRGIEGIAGYLAAERASAAEVGQIKHLFDDIEKLSREGEREEVMLLNHQFHRAIASASHNELLVSQVDELWTNVSLVRASAWRGNKRIEGSRAEHERILLAIVDRNAEEARQAVEQHIRQSWTLVEAAMAGTEAGSEKENNE